jgi:CRP-like cAMP-binding protein
VSDLVSKQHELLERYIDNAENDKAVDLLYKLAVQSAKNKDFINAEGYRDRLYEVDSMALSRIVDVNEIIEAEKSRAITPSIKRMWAPFFKGLSPEEAGSFFFALKEQKIESEQNILEQGQPNDRLFLVHQGNLKMVYQDKDKELLIQRLGAGDIFGQDTFFSINVCTATVKSMSEVRLSYLERATLENLKGALSFFENNLKKVCYSGQSMFDLLRRKGIDRRSYRRTNLQTKVTVQVLSSDSKAILRRPITAELWDVSKIGLSFYFQSKNQEAVRRLVGRTLGISFDLLIAGKQREIVVTGVVQGVDRHPMEEYSVHVRLNRHFSDRAIQTIQSLTIT